ncbi:ABC transporter ATP-binding protein [Natronobacterium gregoryi]|uniref:ABC transporter ATP-binding protein n=2 Tax=Natronobacterium gregoryi TaxID=44930 RepID=L0AG30_NATGS|nr:ABC transporter ATP-binding protein [Natronobacterium gregoryi]AFZ72379.1 oligopeptide/dipeptide ABC transporter, ATP-binding protein [Natronobacterium gregoryi SP2]ELY64236.1 peptide ABC transporter ATPase [Natronobacterium gregoryi SP2]PLK20307.1 ABC transporter ATP-binding protein [Natronobacterium gregoryi SP2]SFJ21743.1 peptide/nickel transport system ATP-binding protein [Natronobacterium gregoryi]
MTLLDINGLKTYYRADDGWVRATDDASLSIERGETVGLVGESGSGKTTLAKSIIRLLPDNAEIRDGSIEFEGTEVTDLSDRELRKQIRWSEISMIPQNAMNGFDPVYTVGEQIVEVVTYHENDTSKAEARERARDLFDDLGIDPDRVDDYPHQFSGGMAQRAMIALALSLSPSLVLADEPTTALDVVIQDRILDTIKEMQTEINSAMIMVTHDMSVVSETCDRIAVVYGGRIVEIADAETIITNPRHPYTLGLRNAFPDISDDDQELISIPGTPPDLVDPGEGCRFAPRCPFAREECWKATPETESYGNGHRVKCHRADEIDYLQEEAGKKSTWHDQELGRPSDDTAPIGGDQKAESEVELDD